MAVSVYQAPGTDPAYAGIAAQLQAQRQGYISANSLSKKQVRTAYDYALGKLNTQEAPARQHLDASLEARGVASSGEANTRMGALRQQFVLGRSDLANQELRGLDAADQQLSGQLSDWGVRQQQAIADSQARALARQRSDEQNAQKLAVAQLPPGINFADPYFHPGAPHAAAPVVHAVVPVAVHPALAKPALPPALPPGFSMAGYMQPKATPAPAKPTQPIRPTIGRY